MHFKSSSNFLILCHSLFCIKPISAASYHLNHISSHSFLTDTQFQPQSPHHCSSNTPILFLPLFPLSGKFILPDFHMTLSLIAFKFLLKHHLRRTFSDQARQAEQQFPSLFSPLTCFIAVKTTL